jgi:radical SAM protein with 4Fe4S-binding SPASM domain
MKSVFHFLSALSAGKTWNFFLVNFSYFISLLLKKPVVWGKPYFISIEPCCLCSLECPECPTGMGKVKRENLRIDPQLYRAILTEIKSSAIYLMLYFQGEPFMNDAIFSMIKEAKRLNLFTATSTNGQFLNEYNVQGIIDAGLDRLVISVDGTDQETYEKYRVGGSLEKVLSGTERLLELQSRQKSGRPEIIFQFLVFRHNQHQIGEMKSLTREMGVDQLWIKSAQIYGNKSTWVPDKSRYTRYDVDGTGKLKLKGRLKNRCGRLWRTMVITTDGVMVPCCFDKVPDHPMGSLNTKDVMEIWKGEEMNHFRRKILQNRGDIEICQNCTEGILAIR